ARTFGPSVHFKPTEPMKPITIIALLAALPTSLTACNPIRSFQHQASPEPSISPNLNCEQTNKERDPYITSKLFDARRPRRSQPIIQVLSPLTLAGDCSPARPRFSETSYAEPAPNQFAHRQHVTIKNIASPVRACGATAASGP